MPAKRKVGHRVSAPSFSYSGHLHKEKSILSPTWMINFIRVTLDSVSAQSLLPTEWFQVMNSLIAWITCRPRTAVRGCPLLFGHMTSCSAIFRASSTMSTCLAPIGLLTRQRSHQLQSDYSCQSVSSLTLLLNLERVRIDIPFNTATITIVTDASLLG